jgi:hypothetical protein
MVRSRHHRDRTAQSSAGEGFGGMTVEDQGAVAGQRDAGTRTRLAPPGGRAEFRHFPLALIAGFQVRLETLGFVRIEGPEYPSGDVRVRNVPVSH